MPSKRAHGEGSITQRKDGRWQAALQVEGRRRVVYGRTRREAADMLGELKRQAAKSGGLPDPGRRTVGDLLDAWLETVTPNLKPATIAQYRLEVENHVRPALGHVRLARLNAAQIQRLITALQASGRRRTASLVLTLLRQVLAMAVRWGWIAANPADRVVRPQHRAPEKTMWDAGQLGAFLQGTAGYWLGPLWVVAVATGCRLGELLGLTWGDVDMAAGTLAVQRTLQRVAGEWISEGPKTRAGARTLALPGEALAALQRQRAWQAEHRLRQGPDWPATDLGVHHPRGAADPPGDGGPRHGPQVRPPGPAPYDAPWTAPPARLTVVGRGAAYPGGEQAPGPRQRRGDHDGVRPRHRPGRRGRGRRYWPSAEGRKGKEHVAAESE